MGALTRQPEERGGRIATKRRHHYQCRPDRRRGHRVLRDGGRHPDQGARPRYCVGRFPRRNRGPCALGTGNYALTWRLELVAAGTAETVASVSDANGGIDLIMG